MASALSAPHFNNEDAAFAYVEARLWPTGPVCPHCGETVRVSRMGGKATRKGLHKCYACRKQFTVRQGTIFESSHLPLNVWLQAIFLIAASKKGISSHQLHRMLGITLKTAWFLSHRIREAMRDGGLDMLGGEGKIVDGVDQLHLHQLHRADLIEQEPPGVLPPEVHLLEILIEPALGEELRPDIVVLGKQRDL